MAYAHSLGAHREGWCQRISFAVLNCAFNPVLDENRHLYMVNGVWSVDSDMLLVSLRGAGKRRCKAECSVWNWPGMEIGLQDFEHELQVVSEKILSRFL